MKPMERTRKIGIFSTLPVEVLFAAGAVPIDVNNLFVSSRRPEKLLELARLSGFPNTVCAWTRGLLGAVLDQGIQELVVVPHGDCSMNAVLAEALELKGLSVHRFHFPVSRGPDAREVLADEIGRLAEELGTSLAEADAWFQRLRPVREHLQEVDRQCWQEGRISGEDARIALLSSTDMGGDPELFDRRLLELLSSRPNRPSFLRPRVALFGVPNIFRNLVPTLEDLGLHVVLCETEHHFAMLPPARSLVDQYLDYPYPYGLELRMDRFLSLAREREVHGVIDYHQSFCHHNLESVWVERKLSHLPTLSLEAGEPAALSPRDMMRVSAFSELLKRRSGIRGTTMRSPEMSVRIGLDIGSRFTKIAALQGRELKHWLLDSIAFYRRFARPSEQGLMLQMESLLEALRFNVPLKKVTTTATGYGRHVAGLQGARVVPEIMAHAYAAASKLQARRLLLVDFGGQDTKACIVSDREVQHFVANDRCAAGSGRYVENMARLLGMDLEEVIHCWQEPVPLSQVCATFGESEVVGHLVDGVPLVRIAAGVMDSVCNRTLQLVGRLPITEPLPLVLSGGLANSRALALGLSHSPVVDSVVPMAHPQFAGAHGCLLDSGAAPEELEREPIPSEIQGR